MSWHFLQGREEASWAESCLDGAPSALLSLMPTAAACCLPDSGMDACRDSRSGTTFRRLTGSRGADTSMSSVGDSPAWTSALPEGGPGSKARGAACGNTWRELSVRFDRDLCSWKTHQCLLSEDLPWSSVTLPRWGMMRDGVLWERTTLVLPTCAIASGFWPTPNAADHKGAGKTGKLRDRLDYAVERGATKSKTYWPTPQAYDSKDTGPHGSKSWTNHVQRRSLLAAMVKEPSNGGKLNPEFSEWLMGWPIGFSALSALATDKFQQWLRSHGVCLEGQRHED
jgi:hypothetical protein